MSDKTDILNVARNVLAAHSHRKGTYCLNCRLAEGVIDLSADKDRLDWIQKRFGEQPWKLVGTLPGTNDIREAIDRTAALEGKDLGGLLKGGV